MDRGALEKELRKYLSKDYCARCDSFGHVTEEGYAAPFCGVCWDSAKPIPYSLQKLIEELIGEPSTARRSR